MLARCGAVVLVLAVGVGVGVGVGSAAAAPVALTLSATVGPDGTTILVDAPGCNPTPPGTTDIVVQTRSATGEIGEGAVAVGVFSTPGHGSAVIPSGTPGTSFLVSVACNDGALTGSQPFVLTEPAAPAASVVAPARFTG